MHPCNKEEVLVCFAVNRMEQEIVYWMVGILAWSWRSDIRLVEFISVMFLMLFGVRLIAF